MWTPAIFCLLWSFHFLAVFAEDGDEELACSIAGQTLNGPSGTIKTPGYPNAYPPRRICKWKFENMPKKFISFEFVYFDFELANDCKPDALEILTLNPLILLNKFCGFEQPPTTVVSADRGIMLRFRSDDMYESRGAQIKYTILDLYPTCSENQFRCKSDLCIPMNKTCNKYDDCGDGSDEQSCNFKVEEPKICGKPKHTPEIGNEDRVIGGREAVPNSWPWQISIQNIISFPSGHFCGGALINNLWIVTAAHCLIQRRAEGLRIHLGMHHRFVKDEGEIIRYAAKLCTHPDFDPRLKDDIALIKLNAPVSYTDTIQPVCLPSLDEKLEDGTYCHVTGWGATYGTGNYHVLKQARLPIIDHDRCDKMKKIRPISPNSLCLGYPGGYHSPCYGDSGGPLVCDYNDSWYLSGIVSWGPIVCGMKEPSIFTKIADYRPWIEKIIENDENNIPNRCQ